MPYLSNSFGIATIFFSYPGTHRKKNMPSFSISEKHNSFSWSLAPLETTKIPKCDYLLREFKLDVTQLLWDYTVGCL